MTESKHNYTLWFIIYSATLNIFLLTALSFIIYFAFKGSEWNAGWIAARNNPDIVEVKKGRVK